MQNGNCGDPQRKVLAKMPNRTALNVLPLLVHKDSLLSNAWETHPCWAWGRAAEPISTQELIRDLRHLRHFPPSSDLTQLRQEVRGGVSSASAGSQAETCHTNDSPNVLWDNCAFGLKLKPRPCCAAWPTCCRSLGLRWRKGDTEAGSGASASLG